jgi:hypothetical protein
MDRLIDRTAKIFMAVCGRKTQVSSGCPHPDAQQVVKTLDGGKKPSDLMGMNLEEGELDVPVMTMQGRG